MIFSVPIEPLQERYTEQWFRWFPDAFKELDAEFQTIEGDQLTTSIETGKVLDVYGTHFYKFSQLQKLVRMIQKRMIANHDTIFFHDLWFPGIECLAYIRQMTGLRFKIAGILHAGTWDAHDFTYPMRPWAKHIEQGWLNIFDQVFVGSHFHRDLICEANEVTCPVRVTGLPFNYKEVQRPQEKENIIVFPHRLDKEKCPEKFDRLVEALEPTLKQLGWRAMKTKDVCQTKEEYYQLLGRAKIAVSFAEQETFGFAMLEAVANGCTPVVPARLSYRSMEMYEGYRFEDFGHAVQKVKRLVERWEDQSAHFEPYLKELEPSFVIQKMISYL